MERCAQVYSEPGAYTARLRCPPLTARDSLVIEMYNEHHQYFSDSIALDFNVSFYRFLKWIILLPFLVLSGVVTVFGTLKKSTPLTDLRSY